MKLKRHWPARLTTHRLADALSSRKDAPLRTVSIAGRFIVIWEDKGKNPIMTTVSTKEFLGK